MQDHIHLCALYDNKLIPVTVFELDLHNWQAGVTAVKGQPFCHWVGGIGHQFTPHAFIDLDNLRTVDNFPATLSFVHTNSLQPVNADILNRV